MKLSHAYNHTKNAVSQKIPVMLWGPPGIGKSSIVNQAAESLGMHVIDLRLSQLDPTDFRGVPMPNRDSGRSEWFLPSFWPERAKSDGESEVRNADGTVRVVKYKAGDCTIGPGIVFLDELEKAPVSVKNASLQFVYDRAIGAYQLPDDWAIVCAGNREEDGCFSQPLGFALSNRMLHFEVETNVDDWSAWARKNGVLDDIIGFVNFRSDLLYQQTGEHAFPTPRSWEMGSKLLQAVDGKKQQKELLQASVGVGTAHEFTVWQEVYRNINARDVVLNGDIPNLESESQSFRFAVAFAVATYLRKDGKIAGHEANVAKFLKCLTAELRVVFLKHQTLPTLETMLKHPDFNSFVKEMMKVVV